MMTRYCDNLEMIQVTYDDKTGNTLLTLYYKEGKVTFLLGETTTCITIPLCKPKVAEG